jgi:alpha-glucosidase
MAMLLTLRGSVCIYQGEELGLTEAELQYEDLVDPYGINFWPEYKGRDGCRTPMVWHHEETHGGFSSTSPWLPVYDDHYNAAVALQHAEDNSVLTAYRSFLGWRREQSILLEGDIEFLKSPKDTLVFVRSLGEERLVIALNLSETGNTLTMPAEGSPIAGTPDFIGGQWHGKQLKLGPWGIEIARL